MYIYLIHVYIFNTSTIYIYVQYIFNTCTSSIDFTFVLVVKCGKLCLAWSMPSMIRDKYLFGFTLALMLCL